MKLLIVGASSGFFMGLLFLSIATIAFFPLLKNNQEYLVIITTRFSTKKAVLKLVLFTYLVWGFIGALLALSYAAIDNLNPGSGIGSPNLAFTFIILVTVISITSGILIFVRRMVRAILLISLGALGIFGWLLPILVA